MSNIRDVAKRAGVAPITVSRVINNSGYISRETRERVEAVVAELQYVPNSLARSLRFNQTKTIGLVVPDITNPFDTTIARGVEDVAHEHDFNVFLCNTDGAEEKQANYLTALLQKRVDGILLVPVRNSDQSVQPIQQQGVPVVVLDLRISYPYVDVVRGDSEGGAYQLVQFLLGLGHRQIAMLSGPVDMSTAVDRVAGYRRAMSEAGLESNEALIYLGAYSIDGGYDMMQQVLQKSLSPTAVFAGNTLLLWARFGFYVRPGCACQMMSAWSPLMIYPLLSPLIRF